MLQLVWLCCWQSPALKQSYFLSLKCPWAVLRLPTRRDPCGISLCSGIAHPWSRGLEQGWNDPVGLAVLLLQQRRARALPFQGLFAPHPPEQLQSCKYNDWMRKEPWESKLGVWNRLGALEREFFSTSPWVVEVWTPGRTSRQNWFFSLCLLFKASSNSKRSQTSSKVAPALEFCFVFFVLYSFHTIP